jgi:hypothetical protein
MNKKEDLNKLLTEEAKRMMSIVEYSFIGMTEDDEEPADLEGEPALDADAEAEAGTEPDADMGGDAEVGAELDGLEDELGLGDEPAPDEVAPDEAPADVDISMDEPAEDEVELDITQLVGSTEDAKASSDAANAKLEDLIKGFAALQQQLGVMQQTSAKIDELGNKVVELEHDIERRNPTPEEQIEMRSLDSYPYNIKLSDYWSEKEDKLAIPSSQQNGGTKEYTLTKQEANNFSPSDIKKSFSDFEEDEVEF